MSNNINERIARKRFAKNNKRKRKCFNVNKSCVRLMKNKCIIRAPKVLDIYNHINYEETLRFINSFEKIDKQKIIISFTSCEEVKAAALVLLYAKLETILKSKSDVLISFLYGANFFIKKIINHSGIEFLCSQKYSENNFNTESNHLAIISGVGGQYRDDIIDFIKANIYKNKLSVTQESEYSDAIQEAINNVGFHAYPNQEPQNRFWWLRCSLIKDELYLILYDQGAGIPNTFSKGNKIFDEIDWDDPETLSILAELRDKWSLDKSISVDEIHNNQTKNSQLIGLAMTDDITRVSGKDESKHGQGSKSIKKLVSNNENGMLWIFSNNGLFRFTSEEDMPMLDDFNSSINGTLIQWNIKVI
ncbi:hypothetical protein [Haemophilus parahaemolyticus]|uniref:hypothetical protein n=1 Tax=Haemophilus parahaemolyticus TaxID=735 RepID=UPI0028D18F93|nr:hypothetical protein [Haemophilus parahaemolyticus]